MKKLSILVLVPLLLLVAQVQSAGVRAVNFTPVAPQELGRYIGSNLYGKAYANLGVVSAADRTNGVVALVGRHGELANIHHSLLYKNGAFLAAPALTAGDIARVSGDPKKVLVQPSIIIQEFTADSVDPVVIE
jgi:hypothetical protein